MVSFVMGPSYAGHDNIAGLCDLAFMVGKTDFMGVAGTHLVRASLSTDISPFELGGAVEILHRKRIAESENPKKLRAGLVKELLSKMRAFPIAKVYGFDDVIDPRDTRPILIRAIDSLPRKNPNLPSKKHGIAPV